MAGRTTTIGSTTSFFTPWHGLLYATYLVVAAVMLARVLKTHGTGTTWRDAVPDGYVLSLVGVALFLIAGIGGHGLAHAVRRGRRP